MQLRGREAAGYIISFHFQVLYIYLLYNKVPISMPGGNYIIGTFAHKASHSWPTSTKARKEGRKGGGWVGGDQSGPPRASMRYITSSSRSVASSADRSDQIRSDKLHQSLELIFFVPPYSVMSAHSYICRCDAFFVNRPSQQKIRGAELIQGTYINIIS